MYSTDIYAIIGAIHFFGFLVYMFLLKFGLKKSVNEKLIGFYILGWLIGIIIFSFAGAIMLGLSINEDVIYATFIELIGFAFGFLVIDGFTWYFAKRIYKKIRKN